MPPDATTYKGWFLGGGVEYALSGILPFNGLFWRTVYRFSRYDAQDVQEFFNNGVFCTGNLMKKDIQTVTSSLVWRFNWFGR